MTNEEAAKELERIANVCQTTQLSIAAMIGANALKDTASAYERGKADGIREYNKKLKQMLSREGCK